MNNQIIRSGDFHAHLDDPRLKFRVRQILNEYFAFKYSFLVAVVDAYQPESFSFYRQLASSEKRISLIAGAHPHNAGQFNQQTLTAITDLHQQVSLLAIGECGLDFHYNFSFPDEQRFCFQQQVLLAKKLRLPLIIHSRQAEEEIISVLQREEFDFPFIMHCYSGSLKNAEKLLKLNGWLSFSGIITFKKADELRQVVAATPLQRLLIETDSPYLTPEPLRGQTNLPQRVEFVAEKVAFIKKISLELLHQQLLENFSYFKNRHYLNR